MYGNVNRKKHPDGGYYRDYFYYACKHRTLINGHRCSYKKQWSEDKINAAVEEIIRKLVNQDRFRSEIKKHIDSSIDTDELDREYAGLKERLKQVLGAKNKLAQQMDHLSVSDRHYDKKYNDMQERMDKFYDEIEEIESGIEEVKNRIHNIKQQKVSTGNVYKRYFSLTDKRIAVQEGMSESQTLKTLIHEMAHSMLYDREVNKTDLSAPAKDRNTKEVEAESIAYIVCQHVEMVILLSQQNRMHMWIFR